MKMLTFALVALALAGPVAAAQQFELVVTGTLAAGTQPPGTAPFAGLNFGVGNVVSVCWRVDTANALYAPPATVGGTGTNGAWSGIFSGGDIRSVGNGGTNPIVPAQTAQSS